MTSSFLAGDKTVPASVYGEDDTDLFGIVRLSNLLELWDQRKMVSVEVKCQFYFYFIDEVRSYGGGFDGDLDDGVGDGNVVPAGFVHNPQQEVRRVEKARGPNIKLVGRY